MDFLSSNYLCAGIGLLSLYNQKSFTRSPNLSNIGVIGQLRKDGTFKIEVAEDENETNFYKAKRNLRDNCTFQFNLFPDVNFFKGNTMDEFNYLELSENVSTFIFNGKILSFDRIKNVSFIGRLKKIGTTIYFDTSFSFLNNTIKSKETNYGKVIEEYKVGIDLSFQLKLAIA